MFGGAWFGNEAGKFLGTPTNPMTNNMTAVNNSIADLDCPPCASGCTYCVPGCSSSTCCCKNSANTNLGCFNGSTQASNVDAGISE